VGFAGFGEEPLGRRDRGRDLVGEVRARGRFDATDVHVMAAITNAAAGLTLPAGYTASVVAGTPIGGGWTTLGVVTIPHLEAGLPRIAAFDLPSTSLPLPASLPGNSHFCMLAFLHSAADAFTSTQRNADLLTLGDRKVAQKNLHIVEFVGTPPAPGTGPGRWAMLLVNGTNLRGKRLIDLVIDARRFKGALNVVLPPGLFPAKPKTQAPRFTVGAATMVKAWAKKHQTDATRLFHEAKYPKAQFELLMANLKVVAAQRPLTLQGGQLARIRGLPLGPKDRYGVFIRIEPAKGTKLGASMSFDVSQVDAKSAAFLGGSRYQVVVNRKAT